MQIDAASTFYGLDLTQALKIEKIDDTFNVSMIKMVDHIRAEIESMGVADAARVANWYFEAHEFARTLASDNNVSVEIAAGVISAVSPRMPWLRNKKVAAAILAQFRDYSAQSAKDAAKAIGLALSTNVAMAVEIARGGDIDKTLTGIKRRSFFNNIIDPFTSDSVTVDTWMLMAFVNITGTDKATGLKYITSCEKSLDSTGGGYYVISEAVREVAREMNLKPHQVQALYWVSQAGHFDGSRTDIN